ncbi:MAG: tRNA dihydrouridine synthase [Phycisphaerae bacterium]
MADIAAHFGTKPVKMENRGAVSQHRLCRIGTHILSIPAMQAGLAGYSDMAMRVVARRRGCPYAVTEALLDRVILTGGRGREKRSILCAADHPVAGQLMGSQADEMAAAAKILREVGFDVIDLNFACPVKKVMGRCRGGYLLSDPEQAIAIMRAVRAVVPGPLSMKLRRALDATSQAAEDFDRVCNEAVNLGFAALAVHGRTVEQKYTGSADWNFLRNIKTRYPNMTIFGSGDVFTAQDAWRLYTHTGVDGVWIARGAIGNPWIFREFAALIAGEPMPQPPGIFAQKEALLEHFALAVEIYGEASAARQMRKIGIKYARLHPQGADVWRAFIAVKSKAHWDAVLDRFYSADGPGRIAESVPDAQDLFSDTLPALVEPAAMRAKQRRCAAGDGAAEALDASRSGSETSAC